MKRVVASILAALALVTATAAFAQEDMGPFVPSLWRLSLEQSPYNDMKSNVRQLDVRLSLPFDEFFSLDFRLGVQQATPLPFGPPGLSPDPGLRPSIGFTFRF